MARWRAGVLAFLACFFCALPPAALGEEGKSQPEALRSADTSSPRDTLASFIADSRLAIEDVRKNRRDKRTYLAIQRASQTLDFSTTPDGDTWLVRARRVALLQELLARVELPPAEKIPGDREVADGTITQWTIPDTGITIAKVTRGPRAGQFLFSAQTVQGLDRLYRQAKELPYRPGATPGIYERITSAENESVARETELRRRLRPVDTSSPRSSFEGFLDHVNQAYELASDATSALLATPPTTTREEALAAEAAGMNLLQRASDTLDLSQIPEALRLGVGIEATLLLKEILDRMLLPPLDAVPSIQMVEESRRKSADDPQRKGRAPFRWKLPNTEIEIVEIVEGERQGRFLFSAATVRQLGTLYGKVKDLPYRQEQFGGVELDYLSPGLSPGFYERYISESGYLVPQAHVLGRVVDTLPGWFKAVYAQQMVWQWAGLLAAILVIVALVYFAYRRIHGLAIHSKSPRRDWLNVLAVASALAIVTAMGVFADRALKFTSGVQAVVTTVTATTLFLLAAWLTFVACLALAETIVATPRMRHKTSESALLRIGAWMIGFLAAIWIVIVGIRSLGADLIPLLAGLGLGGLALALAAQSTIANFIGGLILLANKPVEVGDFCRYGEDPSPDWLRIGTVEEINWLSTRLRGIDRTVTTIPNAAFASMHIVNLTKRDQRLVRTTLQLRYETTPEQMRFILVRLRELLLGHPRVSPDPARARFVGYGAYSKDIEIFCYLTCAEQNEFLAIQEDLLLRIEDTVKEAGSGFAFPSQTAYLARDGGLDEKSREGAEERIAQLRETGKLPFPEFEEEDRRRLEDILDYPPKGSPAYRPRNGEPDPKKGT